MRKDIAAKTQSKIYHQTKNVTVSIERKQDLDVVFQTNWKTKILMVNPIF